MKPLAKKHDDLNEDELLNKEEDLKKDEIEKKPAQRLYFFKIYIVAVFLRWLGKPGIGFLYGIGSILLVVHVAVHFLKLAVHPSGCFVYRYKEIKNEPVENIDAEKYEKYA